MSDHGQTTMSEPRLIPHSWANEAVELAWWARSTKNIAIQQEASNEIRRIACEMTRIVETNARQYRPGWALLIDAMLELSWSLEVVDDSLDRLNAANRVLSYDHRSPMTDFSYDLLPLMFTWYETKHFPALPREVSLKDFHRRYGTPSRPESWTFVGPGNAWRVEWTRYGRPALHSHFEDLDDRSVDFLDWLKKDLKKDLGTSP